MDIDNLEIRTDSLFLFKCMTMWVYQWERNGWRNTAGFPLENKLEIQNLVTLSRLKLNNYLII